LEYTSIVWDPIYNYDVHGIESIQRRAARWVLKDYNRHSSVTSMLQQLSWPELSNSTKNIYRLLTFHKIVHSNIPISIPSNYLPMTRKTMQTIPSAPFHITTNIYYSLPKKLLFKNGTRMELLT